jgi:hypothetical protein
MTSKKMTGSHFRWVILEGHGGVGDGVACSAEETKTVNHHSLNSMSFEFIISLPLSDARKV